MRGKLICQIGAALDTITRVNESRHQAKLAGEVGIFSITSRHAIGQRLLPLADYLGQRGLKDMEVLDEYLLQAYLASRLEHHASQRNSLQTFRAELSAIRKLEEGLSSFSQLYRDKPEVYDFQELRSRIASKAKACLASKTSPYYDRAYPDPEALLDAIGNPRHALAARIQLEAGCRTEGVGAPSKTSFNPLTARNFLDPHDETPLGVVSDPVSGREVGAFWTVEKGGKLAFHFCSVDTLRRVETHLRQHGSLEAEYKAYLATVNYAARMTGQFVPGRGTHGLRHNFAQRRYAEAIRFGYPDENAKLLVSKEMSHNRPDITETYLR